MNVSTLKAMGFEESTVTTALRMANNDAETALELLLSGAVNHGEQKEPEVTTAVTTTERTAATTATTTVSVVPPSSSMQSFNLTSLAFSQYSFPNGTSACTAIALTTMADLLTKLDTSNSKEVSARDFALSLHNEAKLSEYVINGIAEYDKFTSFSSVTSEHLTADEFFAATESLWSCVKKVSLSNSTDKHKTSFSEPLQRNLTDSDAIRSIFKVLRSSATVDKSKYIGIVLTKPPETIMVILPPPDTPPSITNSDAVYFLFDSHSRPSQGIEGAYFYTTTNEREFIERIKMCFPVVDMRIDDCSTDGSLLAELYNTIEANAYQSFEDSSSSEDIDGENTVFSLSTA